MPIREKLSKKQREEFTKQQLEYFFEMSRPKWGRVITFAFLKGAATGFGVFLGGTILIALLLWILSLLGQIPFINEITDSARESLRQNK